MREREPASAAARASRAVRKEDLRRHLPGVEPERRLTDWGRSERIEGLMDRTLYDFFYRYWFRAEVEGIENVPADRRRAAGVEPLGRAAPGRGHDREGDPRGARRTRAR